MTREIVLDTETTGLSPSEGDRVVEIGCVELINHIPTGQHYHTYINPQRDMPEGAFRVHGLSEQFLSDKPLFPEIIDQFLSFVQDSTLIIHNASFDMGFLNAELSNSKSANLKNQVIDTVQLARKKHPGARVGLDALCRHYGIDNSKRTLHGALLDSEILAEVYLELIGGRQSALSLDRGQNEPDNQEKSQKLAYKPRLNKIVQNLTANQIKDHEELLQTLGDMPLWRKYDLE